MTATFAPVINIWQMQTYRTSIVAHQTVPVRKYHFSHSILWRLLSLRFARKPSSQATHMAFRNTVLYLLCAMQSKSTNPKCCNWDVWHANMVIWNCCSL